VKNVKKSIPGKWTRKEILGHLIDSANVNYNRFINALKNEDLVFDTYPQDEFVKIQKYHERKWSDLLILWKTINIRFVEFIINTPEEKLNKLTYEHNFDKICWKLIDENKKSNLN